MKNLNKKTLIIIASILVVVLVVLTVFILNPFAKSASQEEDMKKKLETMGAEFYEDFYYKQIDSLGEEKADFLKKYETLGIKVDLGNLSRYKGQNDSEEILKEFVNKETNKACDKNKTQVIIYPQSPYDKKSYKLEVKLECGFETEKENEENNETKNNENKEQ